MTPSNKGSVIERPAAGQLDHTPPGAPGALPEPDGAGNGNRPSSSKRNDGRPSEGEMSGGAAAGPLDDVVGEGVPLQERLIVSPCPGRFRAGADPGKANGEYILEGQKIGSVISSDREVVDVKSAFSGWIMGYLVPEGSPVRAAEPVAWLRPH